jgi:hypothetical protein
MGRMADLLYELQEYEQIEVQLEAFKKRKKKNTKKK